MDKDQRIGIRPPTHNIMFPITPIGLESLYSVCRTIYPDQPNPLQVTALVKYWLGGPDPLDYISMYSNRGVPEQNIPPHWHYISFGLSDLHGDGRVHDVTGPDSPSGFGFELTFRLKREPEETAPPTWPATMLQALAKYVFHSGNILCAGDHVSWHCALDNSESRIQHMLMAEDPQLRSVHTPLGIVNFIQVIGVCREELQAAQHWNGPGVLDILRRLPSAGGLWLVTDMRRGESMLELDSSTQEEIERGIEAEGSNLSGVSARCSWADVDLDLLVEKGNNISHDGEGGLLREGPANRAESPEIPHLSEREGEQIRSALRKGLFNTKSVLPPIGRPEEVDNYSSSRKESYDSSSIYDLGSLESTELVRIKRLDGLHLTFNLESGGLLPLVIRGRVKHGRHFTFKSVLGDTAITFVAPSVTGTLVSHDHPYVARGAWLQILVPDELANEMIESLEVLSNLEELILPKTFVWSEHKLIITVVEDK